MRRRRNALAALLVLAVALALVLGRSALLRSVGLPIAGLVTGYTISADRLDVTAGSADIAGLHVGRGGRPLLDVGRLRARFDLASLLGGRAGRGDARLTLDAEAPHLTLERGPDGGFGFGPGPRAHPAAPTTSGGAGGPPQPLVPWNVDLRVRDGSVVLLDATRRLPESRRFDLTGISGRIVSRGLRTAGRLNAALHDDDTRGGGPAAVTLSLDDDARSGGSVVRLRVPRLALRAPLDYVIDTRAARLSGGVASGVDLRWYAFAGGPPHLAGRARVDGAALAIPGLLVPLAGLTTTIGLADGIVTFQDGRARLGAVRIDRLAGAIYDFGAPQFRVGLAVDRLSLGEVARLFAFSRRMPVAGFGRLDLGLGGPVGSPIACIAIDVARGRYGRYPVRRLAGSVIYDESEIDLANLRARYGAIDVGANGRIGLLARTTWRLLARTASSSRDVPYLAAALPETPVEGGGLLLGSGSRLETRGFIAGAGPAGALAGFFNLDPDGIGRYGPLVVDRADGTSIAAALLSNRRTGRSGFWLDARGAAFSDAAAPVLPGLERFRPPLFAGRFDGAIAGIATPDGPRLQGHLRGTDFVTGRTPDGGGGVRLARVDADVAGAFDRLSLGSLRAVGPLGDFAGTGSYEGTTLALEGRYGGSFERLRSLTGDLGARGPIDGEVALAIGPRSTLVQVRDARTPGARVRNVPLERLAGTLAAGAAGVRIFAASAAVAGGSLTGAGPLGGAREPTVPLAVSLAGADAGRLRAAGLGMTSGRLSGFGTLRLLGGGGGGAAAAATKFDGGFDLAGAVLPLGRAAGTPPGGVRLPSSLAASATGLVRVAGSRADLSETEGLVGGSAGSLDGSVAGLGRPGGARYDLELTLPSAEAGPLVAAALPAAAGDEATLAARLHVGGSTAAWALDGRLTVPQAVVHGLALEGFSADVIAAPATLVLRHGRVLVGQSRLTFAGGQRGADGGLRIASPALHLADFDDYFDEGDALAGDGRLLMRFRRRRGVVETQADAELRDVRVRSFALGDASAHWRAADSDATGALAFGGASGRLRLAGTVDFQPQVHLDRLLAAARFDGTARLRDLDVGVWLPVFGIRAPVTGRLDADAVVHGRYPGFDLVSTATLRNGTIDRLPVTNFHLAAESTFARTRITEAQLSLPGLALTGGGTVGLGPGGTVDVRLHASSADVGALALRLGGTALPVTGAAEADLHIDGRRTRPRVSGGFDLERATAGPVSIPRALGQFEIQGRDLVLSDAEIAFSKSTLYLAGSLPLTIAPFGFGPPAAPITLEVQTRDLELSDFAPLLPAGSTLTGRIDGRVRVAGTAGAPVLFGGLSLAGGALVTPLEMSPIRGLGAQVTFAGREMKLTGLRATVGGGALGGEGSVTFADLVHPGSDATYAFTARGRALRLDLPAYGRGTVDGIVKLSHAPGTRPLLAGALSLSDAVIPFSALYLVPVATSDAIGASGPVAAANTPVAAASTTATGAPEPAAAAPAAAQDLALALDVSADRNVRVRSGNVDIGGRGALAISGTRNAPRLTGSFDSTGGTLAYFNTVFRIQRGTVTFVPENGLTPDLNARATTHVSAPDPRNLTSAADVTIDVAGPVTNLNIQLSSDPPYSRDQILGLLFSAPAVGASGLFAQQQGSPQTPGLLAPALPANAVVTRANGDISVGEEAFGVLNAQFTRNLLAPFETAFSSAIGISDLNVNVDYTGQVGFTARKFLGRKIDAVFGESFGYPEQRQSFGFEFRPSETFASQVTVFQSIGQQLLGVQTPSGLTSTFGGNPRIYGAQPSGGTVGFSLSLQRLF